MPSLGWTEILIILVIVLLLFGANKLPDLARSMGRSARIFKSEVKELQNENNADAEQPAIEPSANSGSAVQSKPASHHETADFWERPENQPR